MDASFATVLTAGVDYKLAVDLSGTTVTVYVTELTSTIQEILYDGAQHLSKSDLQSLTGLRKGDAMNPLANELGRQSILKKYQEDGRFYALLMACRRWVAVSSEPRAG